MAHGYGRGKISARSSRRQPSLDHGGGDLNGQH
jgi:hypothetical protein